MSRLNTCFICGQTVGGGTGISDNEALCLHVIKHIRPDPPTGLVYIDSCFQCWCGEEVFSRRDFLEHCRLANGQWNNSHVTKTLFRHYMDCKLGVTQ